MGNSILAVSRVVHLCLPAAFTLVIVSIVLRKKGYALGFGILFYGTTESLLAGTNAYVWPLVFAQVGLVTFVFGKNGLLSAISAVFVYYLALGIFTIDPSRPYFSGCMVNVVILLALAIFAFVSSLGGWQRIFKPQRGIWQT